MTDNTNNDTDFLAGADEAEAVNTEAAQQEAVATKAQKKKRKWLATLFKATALSAVVGFAGYTLGHHHASNNQADQASDTSSDISNKSMDAIENIVNNATASLKAELSVCKSEVLANECPTVSTPVVNACPEDEADYFRACEINAQKSSVERKAEDAQYWTAVSLMQNSDQTSKDAGMLILEQLANDEHMGAMTDLAVMEYYGFAGVEQNKQAALEKLEALKDCYQPAQRELDKINGVYATPVAPAPIRVVEIPATGATVFELPSEPRVVTSVPKESLNCPVGSESVTDEYSTYCRTTQTYTSSTYSTGSYIPAPQPAPVVVTQPATMEEPATCAVPGQPMTDCEKAILQESYLMGYTEEVVDFGGKLVPLADITIPERSLQQQFAPACSAETIVIGNEIFQRDCEFKPAPSRHQANGPTVY